MPVVRNAGTVSRARGGAQAAAGFNACQTRRGRWGYIFPIGHVGSTLLSRLIGSHTGIFSLRESALLRTFAQLEGREAPFGPGAPKILKCG